MKKIAVILSLVFLAGCTSSTEYGPCIGAFDTKKPNVEYKLSAWNTFLAVFFSGLIVPPVLVLANETFCPISAQK